MADSTTRWFLEPRDAGTNENAMADLARLCNATEDMMHYGKLDNEGKPHDVVEVDHAFVAKMERSTRSFHFNFRVFTQKEGAQTMEEWKFGNKSKLRRTKAFKEMEAKVAELRRR